MQRQERKAETRSVQRLVWLYALAWLPYLAAYGVVLAAALRVSLGWAAMGAVANVLPPAILGWAVIRTARTLSSRASSRRRRTAIHVGMAVGYAAASVAGTWLLFKLFHRAVAADWDWSLGDPAPLAWQLLVATLLYVVLAGLGTTWAIGDRLRREEARAAKARELAARSQLAALRARLDPHFLFNTLHSVLALVRRDPGTAEDALERFGELLRYVLETRGPDAEEVTLAEERAFVAGYLALEELRLGSRLGCEMTLAPESLGCRLPAFTLQPLIENAIRHAIEPRPEGGRLAVRSRVEGERLVIEVADDGPGATADEVGEGGIGLELVRERLLALYGGDAGLAIETAPGHGFSVRVWIPAADDRPGAAP